MQQTAMPCFHDVHAHASTHRPSIPFQWPSHDRSSQCARYQLCVRLRLGIQSTAAARGPSSDRRIHAGAKPTYMRFAGCCCMLLGVCAHSLAEQSQRSLTGCVGSLANPRLRVQRLFIVKSLHFLNMDGCGGGSVFHAPGTTTRRQRSRTRSAGFGRCWLVRHGPTRGRASKFCRRGANVSQSHTPDAI